MTCLFLNVALGNKVTSFLSEGDLRNIIIAVDAMGGDNAPSNVIHALSISMIRHPYVSFLIYGDKNIVDPELQKYPNLIPRSTFIHTDDTILMTTKPSAALRQKQSSMALAIDAVHEGKAHGIISAGNTGALMALSKLRLRMIDGIHRPSIASLWPTLRAECVVTDLGANISASAEDLIHYALMGSEYARIIFDRPSPKIGLLNVGTEDMKGNETLKKTAQILEEKQSDYKFNYYGFIEGNDISKGTVDVVVTDGFTGNIALKTAEGVAHLISQYLKGALTSTFTSKIGAWIAKKALMHFKNKVDPRKVNGGVFLGLNGIVVKSHGGADHIAYAAALDLAIDLARGDIIKAIYTKISQHKQPIHTQEITS